ncbi:hypothetical protein [Holospora elegans]|nr:hypothetical protein [Holospora elegans]
MYTLKNNPYASDRFMKEGVSSETKNIIQAYNVLVEESNVKTPKEVNANKIKSAFSNLSKDVLALPEKNRDKFFFEKVIKNKSELCENFSLPKNLPADKWCQFLIEIGLVDKEDPQKIDINNKASASNLGNNLFENNLQSGEKNLSSATHSALSTNSKQSSIRKERENSKRNIVNTTFQKIKKLFSSKF